MDNERVTKIRKIILPVGITILAAILIAAFFLSRAGSDEDIVRVSGNIEVTDAELSFKTAGRVKERLVSEGETVRTGQLVARLESAELEHEAALGKAEAEAVQAALAELEAGSRPEEIGQAAAAARLAGARLEEMLAGPRSQEVEAARAAVARAKAEAERAKLDCDRYERLFKKEVVSAQQFDAARTGYDAASARLREAEEQLKLVEEGPRREQIEQARAALAQAEERYTEIKKGPRKEAIEQARARADQARQARAVGETRLGYATLISPMSGVVLSESVEAGEYVTPGTPVVTVGDLENVWLRAYINETDLARVKVGQRVRVTADTFPEKVYEGRVSFIASQAEFTPKTVQTEKERVKLVYRVKVDISNPNMELKPGMPADAQIVIGADQEGK
jgi:HlyD family secretion protein